MKDNLKPVYLINLAVVLITCVVVAILLLTHSSNQIIWNAIWLCIAFFLASLFISCSYYYSKLFRCHYTDLEIILYWASWIYRRVSYTKIQGITIRGAVDSTYNPILGKDKRQKAVVSGYSSPCSFIPYMLPDGISIMPTYFEENILFRSYLCKEDLRTLLNNTEAPIYVTEGMLNAHIEVLCELFVSCSNRVIVSCNLENGKGNKLIPFSEFWNNQSYLV